MSVNHLVQFMAVAQGCRSQEELIQELEKVFEVYRFDFYGLARIPKADEAHGSTMIVSRWPDKWAQIYITKKYLLIDPSVRYLAYAQRPYRWMETLSAFRNDPHFKRMERMVADANRFGMQDGFVFPIYGRSGLFGHMTVGGKPVDLTPLEIALFDSVAKCAFWQLLELSGEREAMAAAAQINVRLTKREMEILRYLSGGLTSNEMSKLLEISNHTVDWYVNELQDKLNAKNRQHMVALSFRLGLIN